MGYHDDVIQWNIFLVTGTLWGVSTGHRWIPLTKASDAELWRFLWSGLEQTAEQTIETLMFETPLRSLWRHCNVMFIKPGQGTTKARQLRKNVEKWLHQSIFAREIFWSEFNGILFLKVQLTISQQWFRSWTPVATMFLSRIMIHVAPFINMD